MQPCGFFLAPNASGTETVRPTGRRGAHLKRQRWRHGELRLRGRGAAELCSFGAERNDDCPAGGPANVFMYRAPFLPRQSWQPATRRGPTTRAVRAAARTVSMPRTRAPRRTYAGASIVLCVLHAHLDHRPRASSYMQAPTAVLRAYIMGSPPVRVPTGPNHASLTHVFRCQHACHSPVHLRTALTTENAIE